ncbi:MAG: methyltransferase family protein [Armatimonadota bacterium]
MPRVETTDSTSIAMADPASREHEDGPVLPVRGADGTRTRFDEIVTPHPVTAFLFRRRTFLVLLGILAMVPFAKPRPDMLGIGVAVAVLAEAIRIWAAGTIHKTEELTTGGPYAFVRHPLYVGSFLHAVAYSFMSGRWESFAFVIPIFLLLYSAAVSTEEAMLHKLFPRRYEEYCQRVPRFVPRLRLPRRGHGQFSWRQVMINKEYVNLIWLVVLTGLFVWKMVTT